MTEEWIEIEGGSRQEAIERACDALNTTPSYLEYEVVGKGGSKIRARKIERTVQAAAPVIQSKISEEKAERKPIPRKRVEHQERHERPTKAKEEGEKPSPDTPEGTPHAPEGEREEYQLAPDAGAKAAEYLTEIVRYLDKDSSVELEETEDEVYLDVAGDGAAVVIGRHGQTLEALQHLIAKMVGLDRSRKKRLTVDSENYRGRRQETLESMAHRLAERAMRSGRPQSGEPMSAMDRRIMHMALKEDPDVNTKSIGEGRDRRVLVVPRDYRGSTDVSENPRSGFSRGGRGPNRGGSGGRGPRRGSGGDGARQTDRAREEGGFARRTSGPPARKHDSFDVPPDPAANLFAEDPDAPILAADGSEE